MKLPDFYTTKALPPTRPGFVDYEVTIDWGALRAAVAAVGESFSLTSKAIVAFARLMHDAANDEVRVSGLEARYYVRGGLHCPDVDALVLDLLRDPARQALEDEDFLMTLLSQTNRARLAAAALRGWVEHHPDEDPTLLSWHRLLADGRTAVVTKEIVA